MVARIISFMPDWATFLAGLILAIGIYHYLIPDEMKEGVKNFLIKYGFLIVVFIGWLYYRKQWGLVADDPTRWPANIYYATFLAGLAVLLYFLAAWLLYKERYNTAFFVANGVRGSFARYQDIGEWTVFFLGTSGRSDDHFVLPFPKPIKLAVVPKVSWDHLGINVFSITQVFRTDLIDCPPEVQTFIEEDTFAKGCKENIYFGIASERLRTRDPKVNMTESKFKTLNMRIGEQGKELKGKMSEMKGFVTDSQAIQKKLRGESWKPAVAPERVEES